MLFASSLLQSPVDSFNLLHYTATQSFVDLAKSQNKTVYVWTVDSKEHMERCISFGVHGIITNRPKMLQKAIENFDSGSYHTAYHSSDLWFTYSLLAAAVAIICYLLFRLDLLALKSKQKQA
mmetsp:Transcript_9726/g.11189  ORF Transcript_9726/g.11189 Transcript_9726/m.11189 type:complete len:122 (+) Transcript_9726:2-367(+)